MKIKSISVTEVEFVAFNLAKKLLSWNEPIPDFGSRFPNILESCLATPFQTYNKKPLYKKLTGKAAILFYLMIKNHPFENGNKRIAVMTLLVLLSINRKWLGSSPKDLYELAVFVAKSKPNEKDIVVKNIEEFLNHKILAL